MVKLFAPKEASSGVKYYTAHHISSHSHRKSSWSSIHASTQTIDLCVSSLDLKLEHVSACYLCLHTTVQKF